MCPVVTKAKKLKLMFCVSVSVEVVTPPGQMGRWPSNVWHFAAWRPWGMIDGGPPWPLTPCRPPRHVVVNSYLSCRDEQQSERLSDSSRGSDESSSYLAAVADDTEQKEMMERVRPPAGQEVFLFCCTLNKNLLLCNKCHCDIFFFFLPQLFFFCFFFTLPASMFFFLPHE